MNSNANDPSCPKRKSVDLGCGPFRGQASALPDLESSWLIGTITLAGLLAVATSLASALTRRNYARANMARQQTVVPWWRLLYCECCNGIHLPGRKEFVSTSKLGKMLL